MCVVYSNIQHICIMYSAMFWLAVLWNISYHFLSFHHESSLKPHAVISYVLLFRQWKLEHLCYKSGELVTENHFMDQVRCKRYFYSHLYFILCIETFSLKSVSFFGLLCFFSFYVHLLLTICVNPAVCGGHVFVQLDHRKATSLPHHHPFGLFLGGSQAPVWNVLSPVSTRNSFFFY